MRVLLLLLGALALAARGDRYHEARGRVSAAEGAEGARGARRAGDERELEPQHWYDEAFAAIEERLAPAEYDEVARNVVMFLGDGLSVPTLAAARTLLGQRAGASGEEARLYFETFPVTGLAKTYCVDAQVADSACSATAYLCGVKANYGTLGVTGRVPRGDCAAAADPARHVASIAAWALADGRDVGIVTTTRVTHASPGGVYAHSADRDWENDAALAADCADTEPAARQLDIAAQLVGEYPGNKFKVILGGGRREFRPTGFPDEAGAESRRRDGRDLVAEWRAARDAEGAAHEFVHNRTGLLEALERDPDYLLGLFASSHLPYEYESREAGADDPTLADLTEAAVRVLSKNPKGFFLFVEGGRIDHAHHDNYRLLALDETIALSEAVERAAGLLPARSSLLTLTADHAHVMAFSGYSQRGTDILGPNDKRGDDGVPYMTLSYSNGPGYREPGPDGSRPDVTEEDYRAPWWRAPALVPLDSETHGGDDVAVFARGPQAALFSGLYEQSQLPHLMAHAACLGPAARRRAACGAVPAKAVPPYCHVPLSRLRPECRPYED